MGGGGRARFQRALAVAAVATITLVAGCADDTDTSIGPAVSATPPAASATPSAAPSASFPLTIPHALGTATIPEKPERIVALSFEEDLLGAIGVEVVGHGENADAPGELYP